MVLWQTRKKTPRGMIAKVPSPLKSHEGKGAHLLEAFSVRPALSAS